MKIMSYLLFVLFALINSSFGAEFEGPWKIAKKECINQGRFNFQENQGMATIPLVRCNDNSSWVIITNTQNPESIEIEFYDDAPQSYNHRTFHCLPSSVLNFPEGLCAGYNLGRQGVLQFNPKKSQVFYTESKVDTNPDNAGSYIYSVELEKINSDYYKLTRHLKFWLRPPYIQDSTQILYLSR
jgi:hypothetical protein